MGLKAKVNYVEFLGHLGVQLKTHLLERDEHFLKKKPNICFCFIVKHVSFCLVCLFRYNIEQEQKLALETTVLVEQYTVRNV